MIVCLTFKKTSGEVIAAVGDAKHIHTYAQFNDLRPYSTKYLLPCEVVAVLPEYESVANYLRCEIRAEIRERRARWNAMRPITNVPIARPLKGRKGEPGAPFGTGLEAHLLKIS